MTFAFDDKYTMFDVTPVENQFILEHLPGARGDYVKVYLYGLMHCYHPSEELTPESMSHDLNIPVEEILAAFRYWERHGAVRRISDRPPVWQYVSFKEQTTSVTDIDPEYAAFCQALEDAFDGKRVFRGSEMAAIYEWKEGDLRLPTEVILMLLNYMTRCKGKNFKISDAEKKALVLAQEDARTEEKAAAVLARDEAENSGMREILQILGKRGLPSEPNMRLYVKWTRDWGFTQDGIKAACGKMEKDDPNLAILDKILENTYNNQKKADGDTLGKEAVEKASRDHENLVKVMKYLGRSGRVTDYQEKMYREMLQIYPQEIIEIGAEECGRKRKDPESLLKLLTSWKERGFTTKEQVETHIRMFRAKEDFLKQLRGRWNSRETDPGGRHMEMLGRWEDELGMSRELIMKAADYAADVQRPMAYMDALMTRYAEKGIRTAEEAEKDRREFSGQYKEIAQKAAEKSVPAQDYHQRDYSGAQEAAFERMMNLDSEGNHA